MSKAEVAMNDIASKLLEHPDMLRITWLQRATDVPLVSSAEYECSLISYGSGEYVRLQQVVRDRESTGRLEWTLSTDNRRAQTSDPESAIGRLGMYLRDMAAEQLGEAEALRVNQALLRRLKVPGAQLPAIEGFAEGGMERGRDHGYLVPLAAGTVVLNEMMSRSGGRYWSLRVLDEVDGVRALAESPSADSPLGETAELLGRLYRAQTDALVGRLISELSAGLE